LVWITILRLPLQIVLIWWAYLFAKPNAEKRTIYQTKLQKRL
jgi:uncharacterized membrane protein